MNFADVRVTILLSSDNLFVTLSMLYQNTYRYCTSRVKYLDNPDWRMAALYLNLWVGEERPTQLYSLIDV